MYGFFDAVVLMYVTFIESY